MDTAAPEHGAPHRLVAGFDRVRQHRSEAGHCPQDGLLNKQRPTAMVIVCSDSRTDPAIICGGR